MHIHKVASTIHYIGRIFYLLLWYMTFNMVVCWHELDHAENVILSSSSSLCQNHQSCWKFDEVLMNTVLVMQCSCSILCGAANWSVICLSCEFDALVLTTVWWGAHCEWVVGYINPCLERWDRGLPAHADWSPVADQRNGAPRQHPRVWQRWFHCQGLEHHYRTVSADTPRFVIVLMLSFFMQI